MSAVPIMHFTNMPLDSAALSIRDAVHGLGLGTRAAPWSAGDRTDINVGAEEGPVLPSVTRRGHWVAVNNAQALRTPFQSLQEEVKGCFEVVRGNHPPLTMIGFLPNHRFPFSGRLRPHSHRKYKPLHL
jgi:hypothetical protein